MPLTLRLATAADLPATVALMNLAFRGGTGTRASWNIEAGIIAGDRTTVPLLQAELTARPQAKLLVFPHEAGPIQGCVMLHPAAAGTWYLGSLTIDPTLQNSGLGRELLTASEDFAATHGARTMQMTVLNVRATLIAWYERRGYHLTGESRPFPYGDDRYGTPLRDDLAFLILEKSLAAPPDPASV